MATTTVASVQPEPEKKEKKSDGNGSRNFEISLICSI